MCLLVLNYFFPGTNSLSNSYGIWKFITETKLKLVLSVLLNIHFKNLTKSKIIIVELTFTTQTTFKLYLRPITFIRFQVTDISFNTLKQYSKKWNNINRMKEFV